MAEDVQGLMRELLHKVFVDRKQANPAYSLRSVARQLQVSVPSVTEFLSGKRRLSAKMLEKIAGRLESSYAPEMSAILNLVTQTTQATRRKPTVTHTVLSSEQFAKVNEWHHYAILSLAETADFESNASWIAQRLNISPKKVEQSLAILETMGCFRRDRSGRLILTGKPFTSPDGVKDANLRKLHRQSLELAATKIEDVEVALRDFTQTVMAIDLERLPEAVKMIRAFRLRMLRFLEAGEKRQVYNMMISLFPLSEVQANPSTYIEQ